MLNHKDEILLKAIAKQVKMIRKSRKLSQEEVYLDTEIHCARLEQGRLNVTIGTLKHLCDYLGISLSEFFREIESSMEKEREKKISRKF